MAEKLAGPDVPRLDGTDIQWGGVVLLAIVGGVLAWPHGWTWRAVVVLGVLGAGCLILGATRRAEVMVLVIASDRAAQRDRFAAAFHAHGCPAEDALARAAYDHATAEESGEDSHL